MTFAREERLRDRGAFRPGAFPVETIVACCTFRCNIEKQGDGQRGHILAMVRAEQSIGGQVHFREILKVAATATTLTHASGAGASERAAASRADPETEEPIIVTGQKIERSLQETTDSVVVVTEEVIEREPVWDLYDLVERIPNVTAPAGER